MSKMSKCSVFYCLTCVDLSYKVISCVLLYVGCILMVLGPDMLKVTDHHGRPTLKHLDLNTLNTIIRVNRCEYRG